MFGKALTTKHWAVIGGFLISSATIIGGLHSWSDLQSPQVVAGFIGQAGSLIVAVFVGAPEPKIG